MRFGRTVRRLKLLPPREAGGAAVELFVALPLLLLLVIGVVEYGRAFAFASTIAHAARAGALHGAKNTDGGLGPSVDYPAIKKAAVEDGQNASLVPADVTPLTFCRCEAGGNVSCTTASVCGSYGAPGVYVQVTVSKPFSLVFKYPGIPTTIAVSRTATIRAQ